MGETRSHKAYWLRRYVVFSDATFSLHIISCKARFARRTHHGKAIFACRIKFGMASSYFLTWIRHNNS